jgi:hypothetical protein
MLSTQANKSRMIGPGYLFHLDEFPSSLLLYVTGEAAAEKESL